MVMVMEHNAFIVKNAYYHINIMVWGMRKEFWRGIGKPLLGRPARDGRKTL